MVRGRTPGILSRQIKMALCAAAFCVLNYRGVEGETEVDENAKGGRFHLRLDAFSLQLRCPRCLFGDHGGCSVDAVGSLPTVLLPVKRLFVLEKVRTRSVVYRVGKSLLFFFFFFCSSASSSA